MHSSLNNAFPWLFLWYGEPSPAAMWFMRSIQETRQEQKLWDLIFHCFPFLQRCGNIQQKYPLTFPGLLSLVYFYHAITLSTRNPCVLCFLCTHMFLKLSRGKDTPTRTTHTHTHTGIHLHLKDLGLMKQINPLIHTHRISLERRKMFFWRKPLKAVRCER